MINGGRDQGRVINTAYNEKDPWGRDGIAIEGKTIADGRELYLATQAVKNHTATPEQYAIVQGTDNLMQAMAESRRRDKKNA